MVSSSIIVMGGLGAIGIYRRAKSKNKLKNQQNVEIGEEYRIKENIQSKKVKN